MKTRSALVASAAAALFVAGMAGAAYAEEGGTDCKSAQNSCKGKNGCAGKGFMMMTPAECEAAKAKAADKK
ncbi:MAG: hypothetical protein E6J87_09705 [Deltaproteobacteria bacterium]|nr:MAG: hypothetical protein E6J87_09705 [Deltaproteobacteria bacterium]